LRASAHRAPRGCFSAILQKFVSFRSNDCKGYLFPRASPSD
jgi:hypothetical protein